MRSLVDSINESRTRDKEIAAYIESWVKQPQDNKEMLALLGAIREGLKNGLAYREDPNYIDKMGDKYNQATETLKSFEEGVGKLVH